MNIRHAAALALVGWYLMVPPMEQGALQNPKQKKLIQGTAPLSKWVILHGYDNAQQCEAVADRGRHEGSGYIYKELNEYGQIDADKSFSGRHNEIGALQMSSAKCIATDDPRLKEK